MVFLTTGIIGIIALICMILVIYDVWANNKKLSTLAKVIWTIAAILFNILTGIIYYFFGRK